MRTRRTTRLVSSGGLAVAVLAAAALPAAAGGATPKTPPPAADGATAVDGVDTVDAHKLLKPYVELVRPLPPIWHDYKYKTSEVYWSVVAVDPVGRTDVDIELFEEPEHIDPLAHSTYGTGAIDFIVVDSNHRPFGSYYAEVRRYSPAGTYRIELAHGTDRLTNDGETVAVSSTDVVLVRDTFLYAGEEYVFGIGGVPGAILYLFRSDPNRPSSMVQPRGYEIDSTPVGGFQIFAYTPATTDWFGVVVTLPGVAGEVTLIRVGGPGD